MLALLAGLTSTTVTAARGRGHAAPGAVRLLLAVRAGQYTGADADRELADLQSYGYNAVRVFIDHGNATDADIGRGMTHDEPVYAPYMDYVADFLERATAHGIRVMYFVDLFPQNAYYFGIIGHVDRPAVNMDGRNLDYLHPKYVAAKHGDTVERRHVRHVGPDPAAAVGGRELRRVREPDGGRRPRGGPEGSGDDGNVHLRRRGQTEAAGHLPGRQAGDQPAVHAGAQPRDHRSGPTCAARSSWLYWTSNPADTPLLQRFFTLHEGTGEVNIQLNPKRRPDPCTD